MAPRDVLDPGPGGVYPNFPRRADGSPSFTRAWGVDGADEEFDANGRTRAPSGVVVTSRGERLDMALRHPPGHPLEGLPIVPPTLPPQP